MYREEVAMILKEFKEFLGRSNMVDLAAGIVLGSAFTRVLSSFIGDILGPLLSLITNSSDLHTSYIEIGSAHILYGSFVQAFSNFIVVALFLFFVVTYLHKLARKIGKNIVDPLDERIFDPIETKVLGRKKKKHIPKVPVNKAQIAAQVQDDLKRKHKTI